MKLCVECGKELTGKKRKYCNDHCRWRYINLTTAGPGKARRSPAQQIRMDRAARGERKRTRRNGRCMYY